MTQSEYSIKLNTVSVDSVFFDMLLRILFSSNCHVHFFFDLLCLMDANFAFSLFLGIYSGLTRKLLDVCSEGDFYCMEFKII